MNNKKLFLTFVLLFFMILSGKAQTKPSPKIEEEPKMLGFNLSSEKQTRKEAKEFSKKYSVVFKVKIPFGYTVRMGLVGK
jgi:hypothetical protein